MHLINVLTAAYRAGRGAIARKFQNADPPTMKPASLATLALAGGAVLLRRRRQN